mmetsp:Transcript_26047/g.65453  ORF Transcript_26047/g.65453 Transcript_26047/m.65453 type:complete len:222 (+) Transcript_26047:354-1019(+)
MSIQLHLGAVTRHHTALFALLLEIRSLVVVGLLLSVQISQSSLELSLCGLGSSLAGLGLLLTSLAIFEGTRHCIEHGLCLSNLFSVVTLAGVHQTMPINLTGKDQVMGQRNVLDTIANGTALTQFGAHGTHGQRFLESLQEAMSTQLVNSTSELTVVNVDLDELFDILPEDLSIVLALLPVCVQEPNSLLFVGKLAERIELLVVSRTRKNRRSSVSHDERY